MDINEKKLLAILKSIPLQKKLLTYSDFKEEMDKICKGLTQKTIDFLIEYNIIDIVKDHYKNFGGDVKIKMKDPIEYVNLTEVGNFILLNLRTKKIMEDFEKECSQ